MVLADAEVTSANVVGYVTTNAPRNSFIAIGVQFTEVTNVTARPVKVADLITTTNPRAGTAANNNVDQIHVWKGSDWKKYYNRTNVGYVATDAEDVTVPTTDMVNVGDGVFFRKGNYNRDGEAKVCGGVYDGDEFSITLARNAFTAISYPWPIAFPIKEFANIITNPRAGTAANNNVDQIHVWDGSDWKKYYNRTNVGYVATDAEDVTVPTEDVLLPGVGVFLRKGNYNRDGVLTFTKPAGL